VIQRRWISGNDDDDRTSHLHRRTIFINNAHSNKQLWSQL